MDLPRVVFAGCGFLGESAAGFFLSSGWRALGLCATESTARRLSALEFPVRVADITKKMVVPEGWHAPELLVHCASSSRGGADSYRAVYRDGLGNLLSAFAPGQIIFTGSTSVYAQVDGSLVTEESPAEPSVETGKVLLEAEALALHAGGIVARLSGIYGPGRAILLRKFLEGAARIENGGQRWINQIHRDDAAAALLCLADRSVASGIYNVSDDTPCSQRDLYGWIADFLQRPLPPDGPADMISKRGWTSKRVSNAKLRAIGWQPVFPAYRDALSLLVGGDSSCR